MNYKILFEPKAAKDMRWFGKNNKPSYAKCLDLILSIAETPRDGIGKPERLRHYKNEEVYSRQINKKDRMIYAIHEEQRFVVISNCRGHYGDK